ncbi:MAG: sensor histidine kinase [Lachnospiraceae bacterium]
MIKRLKKNIRRKVVISFVMVLVVMMAISSFVVNYFSTRFIKEQIIQYNTQMLSKTIYDFERMFDRVNQFAANMSPQYIDSQLWQESVEDPPFSALKKSVDFEMKVKDSISANNLRSVILGMGIFYNDDNSFYVGEGMLEPKYLISKSDWYQQFIKSGANYYFYGPMMEEFKPANTKHNEILMYIKKIPVSPAIERNYTPVLFLTIRFREIKTILAQLDSDNRLVLLTDEKGEILYMNHEPEAGFDLVGLQRRIAESDRDGQESATYSDERMLVTNMYVDNFKWVLATVDDNQELFKSANDLTININLIIAVCGVGGIIVATYLSRRLMMPIQVLNSFMSTIEDEPETFIKVKGNDEIAQIGTRMNQMKTSLQAMNSKIFLSQVREKEAQLSALQAQINPHFLYNTLDNIYCIAQIEEIPAIVHLTKSLSNMLRYSIDFQDPYVILEKELDHVKDYVSIINERYDQGINLSIVMADKLKKITVLKMILQPIVENAWKHGILPQTSHQGNITISVITVDDSSLEIQIADDGVGMDEKMVVEMNNKLIGIHQEWKPQRDGGNDQVGFGIALTNVNDRIKLKNGENYGIVIESERGRGTKIIARQKIEY